MEEILNGRELLLRADLNYFRQTIMVISATMQRINDYDTLEEVERVEMR